MLDKITCCNDEWVWVYFLFGSLLSKALTPDNTISELVISDISR